VQRIFKISPTEDRNRLVYRAVQGAPDEGGVSAYPLAAAINSSSLVVVFQLRIVMDW
jgi:hypothetical protein